MKSKKKSPKQPKVPKLEDVVFEYLNESTKFVVSATAMVFLMFHPAGGNVLVFTRLYRQFREREVIETRVKPLPT